MKKIWLVIQQSNVNGDMLFNTVVCKDKETAIRMMKQEIDTLLDEPGKYQDARRWMEGTDTSLDYDDCPYSWENDNDDAFYISCVYDDYYELIKIEEKDIQY